MESYNRTINYVPTGQHLRRLVLSRRFYRIVYKLHLISIDALTGCNRSRETNNSMYDIDIEPLI